MTVQPSHPAPNRVVVVDDHALFAEAIDLALTVRGFDVRRVAPGEATGLLACLRRHHPWLVLLDLDLGAGGDATRVIQPLVRDGVQVVVVTASTDPARWGECLLLGARTVLPKCGSLQSLHSVVRRIQQGLPVSERDERASLIARYRRDRAHHREILDRLDRLTAREREVLAHLMLGALVADIARLRFVSQATVRTQVKAILAKLEVSSQVSAVGLANRVGWRHTLEVAQHDRLA